MMRDHPTYQTWKMKVTGNGQISLPAEVRKRWNAQQGVNGMVDTVVVHDTAYGLIIRPFDPDALRNLMGKYAKPGQQSSEDGRRQARLEDQEREDARDGARRVRP
jgi:bifunctional DNA-binding transcriptional regulator/antitoxin component of YhaV-PrlF toxin-antitoxin module